MAVYLHVALGAGGAWLGGHVSPWMVPLFGAVGSVMATIVETPSQDPHGDNGGRPVARVPLVTGEVRRQGA